ncbi:MAG: Gfo/Idh/MocA family protein, partial [Opitutales bacterium]
MLPRRRFLRNVTLASLTFPALVRAQNLNSRLQLVQVGCSGKGGDDIHQIASHPKVRFVGFCDVDSSRFGSTPADVARFADYRVMFDKLGDGFDAAVISTPDHMHALPALRAMRLRKHVYLQKPLAHNLGEVRALRLAAERHGVRTQMGIQIHSASEYRTAVALIRAGR